MNLGKSAYSEVAFYHDKFFDPDHSDNKEYTAINNR